MHTEDFTIFSLDMNFARYLVTCPLLVYKPLSHAKFSDNNYKIIPEALSGLSMILWLFQTTLSLAVITGVGSLDSNLIF